MTRKFVYLSVPGPYGISMVLITAALVYLLAIIIIMHFTSQFAISKKVTPPWVQLLGYNTAHIQVYNTQCFKHDIRIAALCITSLALFLCSRAVFLKHTINTACISSLAHITHVKPRVS